MSTTGSPPSTDFIREIIREDNRTGKHGGRVHTRFPARAQRLPAHRPRQVDLPELRHRPGVRRQVQPALRRHQPQQGRRRVRRVDHGGRPLAGLRLGRPPVLRLRLLRAALRVGRAADQGGQGLRLRPRRPTRSASTAARSPSRARTARTATAPIEENLDLFQRMRAGEFPDGSRTLRAKIDMASPNLNMRDPVMYRILHATHHRTGDKWCIYPMYDCAHGQSRLDRGDHALDLHAGVREPPAALRLVHPSSWASTTRSRSSSPGST